jgi:hypothetical protein
MDRSRKTIPSSYGRALRSVYTYNHSYKAEEWSSFLLYYSPIFLRPYLYQDLYQHYSKLVSAIERAIDYEITFQDINHIRTLLIEFVSEYEQMYYQYNIQRVSACLSTFHLLLHLADSLTDCGPAWVFWQFPCERLCGMLKPMVKNRGMPNRNLALAILYREQFNHLPFATVSYQPSSSSPNLPYTATINGHEYSFFGKKRLHELEPLESSHLLRYYANLLNCSVREIRDDESYKDEITKWASCLLANDPDSVSSEWAESIRDLVSFSRLKSLIKYSQQGNHGLLTMYGRVCCFFVHYFRGAARMLAYVRTYKVVDRSRESGYPEVGKILEFGGEGRMEVVCLSSIDEGIGLATSNGKQYLITRRRRAEEEDWRTL